MPSYYAAGFSLKKEKKTHSLKVEKKNDDVVEIKLNYKIAKWNQTDPR